MNLVTSWWTKLTDAFRARFPGFSEQLPAYVELTRLNRPIGIWLLLWPTLGALWIAAQGLPDMDLLLIFLLGTTLMRSAGCCINDFADYAIDAKVGRTRGRPLARGALRRQDALYCFAVLSLFAFALVLLTNRLTILLALAAVLLVVVYPFMKRFTHLPQLVLGVAFSWGIPMAFSAQTGAVPALAWLLFVANVLWTVAYDTEYAMVDREFDLKAGVRSTAILFGDADRLIIALLQGAFLLAMVLVGRQLQAGVAWYLGLGVATALFLYQQYLIAGREAERCFQAFLNNNRVGAAIFAGILASYWLA